MPTRSKKTLQENVKPLIKWFINQFRFLIYCAQLLKTNIFLIMKLIDRNIEKIKPLCNKHKVSQLFVFGSIVTPDFTKKSDIDLLVKFSGVELYNYADNYFDLKQSLEELPKRPVDLLEDKAIKNPYLRKSIDASKHLIYG